MVFLLLGMRELWHDHPERAAIWTTVAAVIKPQLGILVPIVAAVVIRRYLFDARGNEPSRWQGAAASGGLRARLRAWGARERGPVRIVTTAAAGLATAIVLSLPFGLTLVDLLGRIAATAGGYPYLTVNAYNPWALITHEGNGLAANSLWIRDVDGPDPADLGFMFGPIPAVVVGTALLLVAIAVVSWVVARRPDRLTILVGLCVLALAFFVLPTRVHERYLFPLFALGAILAAVSVRWRVAYVVLSFATFLNMYVVLTTLYPGNPQISDWLGIGPDIRSVTTVTIVALIHLGGSSGSPASCGVGPSGGCRRHRGVARVGRRGRSGRPSPGCRRSSTGAISTVSRGRPAGPAPAPGRGRPGCNCDRGVGRRSRRSRRSRCLAG